jgi:hypothetical protein
LLGYIFRVTHLLKNREKRIPQSSQSIILKRPPILTMAQENRHKLQIMRNLKSEMEKTKLLKSQSQTQIRDLKEVNHLAQISLNMDSNVQMGQK